MSIRNFIPELKNLTRNCTIPYFINGKFQKSVGKEIDNIINPATEKSIGNILLDDNDSCIQAINSSKISFNSWSKSSINKRINVLIEWNNWINNNKDSIAQMITEENGKTIDDSLAELERGIEVVKFSLSAPHYLKGEASIINNNLEILTKKQPLGITAGIMPFNFPAMIPLWMIPLSIVSGNSIIIKSSEKCPSTPLFLAYGATQAGLPDGVCNVIHGNKDITSQLITNDNIEGVSFVGSTNIGKKIYDQATKSGKRTQINMGAKNHAVIMPDCNYEDTAKSIISSFVVGQRCMAISVLVVVDGAEEIIDVIKNKLDVIDPVKDMGPLITKESKNNVINNIEKSLNSGAKIITGNIEKKINNGVGYYMEPILIDNVNKDMSIYKEELFAPILSIVRVPDLDSAINLVNSNQYGNGTAIFTNNLYNATKYENETNITQCGVNVPIPVSPPYYSWTSTKESYRGSHYVYGPSSFDFYTKLKTVMKKPVLDNNISTSMPTN